MMDAHLNIYIEQYESLTDYTNGNFKLFYGKIAKISTIALLRNSETSRRASSIDIFIIRTYLCG